MLTNPRAHPDYCPECRHELSADLVEWVGGAESAERVERAGRPMLAVRYVRERRCGTCPFRLTLGEGTGYWTLRSWDADAEADELVDDGHGPRVEGRHFAMDRGRFTAVVATIARLGTWAEEEIREQLLDTDWPNAAEHQTWLETGDLGEIVAWAIEGICSWSDLGPAIKEL